MICHVLLAGGTGLVGSDVAERLAARPDLRLTSLVRRATNANEQTIDFEAMVTEPVVAGLPDRVDVGISCLGTTIRKAGTQAAFRRVDYDYVIAVARWALVKGARQFILVSSVGAGGRSFYLGVKGEVERAVGALGFERLDVIRPSLLLGNRQEHRPSERFAQRIAPLLSPLLVGPLARYAAIPADAVSAAIVGLIGKTDPGLHIHENPRLGSIT